MMMMMMKFLYPGVKCSICKDALITAMTLAKHCVFWQNKSRRTAFSGVAARMLCVAARRRDATLCQLVSSAIKRCMLSGRCKMAANQLIFHLTYAAPCVCRIITASHAVHELHGNVVVAVLELIPFKPFLSWQGLNPIKVTYRYIPSRPVNNL